MADDKVVLGISFEDDGSGNNQRVNRPTGNGDDFLPENPFGDIPELGIADLRVPDLVDEVQAMFDALKELPTELPSLDNLQNVFDSLAELSELPSLDNFNRIFESLAEVASGSTLDDIAERLASQEREAADQLQDSTDYLDHVIREMTDDFGSFFSEIGETILPLEELRSNIMSVIGAVSTWGARLLAFGVFLGLYNAVLKEVINSLGEYSGLLKAEQANTNRRLVEQSLAQSERLGEQLAANEENRGELAIALEQAKTELFDLFSPILRAVTFSLTVIVNTLNLILGAINLIKDIVEWPFDKLAELFAPLLENAEDDLRAKRRKLANDKGRTVGFADLVDLFDPASVGSPPLPSKMAEDIRNHPFPWDLEGDEPF